MLQARHIGAINYKESEPIDIQYKHGSTFCSSLKVLLQKSSRVFFIDNRISRRNAGCWIRLYCTDIRHKNIPGKSNNKTPVGDCSQSSKYRIVIPRIPFFFFNQESLSPGRRLRLGAWSTMADALITLPAPSDDVRVIVGIK